MNLWCCWTRKDALSRAFNINTARDYCNHHHQGFTERVGKLIYFSVWKRNGVMDAWMCRMQLKVQISISDAPNEFDRSNFSIIFVWPTYLHNVLLPRFFMCVQILVKGDVFIVLRFTSVPYARQQPIRKSLLTQSSSPKVVSIWIWNTCITKVVFKCWLPSMIIA